MKVILEKTSRTIKNPKHLKGNIFIVYSPRVVNIESATHVKIDTEKNSKGFITLLFRGDKIHEFCSDRERLRIEILNKSFEETVKIRKNRPLGFLVIQTEHLKFK